MPKYLTANFYSSHFRYRRHCHDNPDPTYNQCDIPQELTDIEIDEHAKRNVSTPNHHIHTATSHNNFCSMFKDTIMNKFLKTVVITFAGVFIHRSATLIFTGT